MSTSALFLAFGRAAAALSWAIARATACLDALDTESAHQTHTTRDRNADNQTWLAEQQHANPRSTRHHRKGPTTVPHRMIAVLCSGVALTAAVASCSSEHHSQQVTRSSTSGTSMAAVPNNAATVIVDGAQDHIDGLLVCTSYADRGDTVINIGRVPHDVLITVTTGDNPTVKMVLLHDRLGHSLFSVMPPHGDNTATATKKGASYTVTGKAWNSDTSTTTPFRIDLTCP